ncbi:MAG: hypothetical protein SVV03_01190 [Candidatus Nanohaloarchaea archaeon]|nr:hypothetical protein [Candidatus Nanohaloarchaea archaeon]
MAQATKRIPVTQKTWKELGKQKEPGQTWDRLLRELWLKAKKVRLAENIRKAKKGELEMTPLNEL